MGRSRKSNEPGPAWKRLGTWPVPEIAGLAALVLAAAWPALQGGLLSWDDLRYVAQNEHIRSFSQIPYVFTHVLFEAYHPLHLLSYMIDYSLWGLWPTGYHVHNVVLFAAGLVLLTRFLMLLGVGRPWSFLLAALFALHPLHVEPVAWITGRKEVLCFLFFMAGAVAYLGMERWRGRRGVLVILFFLLALLSKSHAVVFPLFLFGIDLFLKKRPFRESLVRQLPLALFALAFSILVYSLWQENELSRPRPESILSHAALVLETYLFYLKKLFVPFPLSPVYPIPRNPAFSVGAAVMAVAAAAFTWLAAKSRSGWARFAWFWFAFSLLPVSNIVPVYFFAADRYAIFCVMSLPFLLLWLRDGLAGSRGPAGRIPAVLLAAGLIVWGALFFNYSRMWRDDTGLWKHAAVASPSSYYAHMKLGEVLRDRGELEQAGLEYRRAIALQPGLRFAWFGLCWSESLREDEAAGRSREDWKPVLAALMKSWQSSRGLLALRAQALARGYAACAEIAETRAFNLEEPDEDALIIAASLWVRAGRHGKALACLDRLQPQRLEAKVSWHLVRAEALAGKGLAAEAAAELDRAEELNAKLGSAAVKDHVDRLRKVLAGP
jgi:tetratricopeptide (TPR) repeat protein